MFPAEVGLEKVLAGARGVSELEIARAPELGRDYELRHAPIRARVLHFFACRR